MDLNSDLGESFGRWTLGDDAAACRQVRRSVVGAQVGYRDLAGFGRRFIDVQPGELADDVVYQIGALQAMCRVAGIGVRHDRVVQRLSLIHI